MSRDLSLPVREAIVAHLRASPGMLELVPAESQYGRFSPPDARKPFTRYGVPTTGPWYASCVSGSLHEVTLHAFTNGPYEDEAEAIAAAMVEALDGVTLSTPELDVTITWTGGQTINDAGEPTDWHAYRTFDVSAAT